MWNETIHQWQEDSLKSISDFSINPRMKRRLKDKVYDLGERVREAKKKKWLVLFDKEKSIASAETLVSNYMYYMMPTNSKTTAQLKREFTGFASDLLIYLKRSAGK